MDVKRRDRTNGKGMGRKRRRKWERREKGRECNTRVWEVGTVGKISDCQQEEPGFNPRPGRGLNFGRPSFATPSVDRDVKPLV